MKVHEVMSTPLHTIGPEDPVDLAARRMRDFAIGALPVRDGGRLLGMVTDRDLTLRVLAPAFDARTTPVRQVMTPELITCGVDDEVMDVARTMVHEHIRRLPVLDPLGVPVGLVSLDDIAVILSAEEEEEHEPAAPGSTP